MHANPQIAVTRYSPLLLSLVPAVVISTLLVLLMDRLIATDFSYEEPVQRKIAELIRVQPDEEIIVIDKKPEKPPEVLPPPDILVRLPTVDTELPGATWQPGLPMPDVKGGIDVNSGGGVVAYLKPAPIYPGRALSRGIEGYVDLAFDIVSSGATANIRILDAQPGGVFEKAAVTALKKWKYKLPVLDGVAQPQVDMMTRMTFALEE